MVVLSLFDGMSCGQIALKRAKPLLKKTVGAFFYKYYASEIDKYAIKVTQANFPDTIQLGSIENWREWNIEKPDIIIGGSPCQGFSFTGTGLNFEDPRSKLFFTYSDIVKHYNPKHFLLENVKMEKEHEDIISQYMGIEPTQINSALVSAQNRKRLYWTNISAAKGLFGEEIPGIEQPEDKKIYLKDILEKPGEPDRGKSLALIARYSNATLSDAQIKRYKEKSMHQYIKCGRITGRPVDNHKSRVPGQETEQILELRIDEKTNCLSTVGKDNIVVYELPHGYNKGGIKEKRKMNTLRECTVDNYFVLEDGTMWRKLTPVECERLQTVPDNYTNHVSNRQRYKMLGNGWTVDVIVHILKGIEL